MSKRSSCEQVSVVMEQFIRLLHKCEMPLTDMDFINSDGPVMNKLLLEVSLVKICMKLAIVNVTYAHCYVHVTLTISALLGRALRLG
jgi:hypothetical protein